ncbi:MAG: MATE family efflux transporter [Pseudohongiella sp.]|nr:MATE family efflux transporter [Pseudohongiella sp.]
MLLARLHFNMATLRTLMAVALPMVVSQGAFAVMIFTDRYFMSQIDPTHMAASLGGGVAFFFSLCFFLGVISYANALVAQYRGAGHAGKCSRVVTQGLLMGLLCQPIMFIIGFYVLKLFLVMGHEQTMLELESSYYAILMLGSLFALWKGCLSSYFAGISRTRVVMVCDVAGLMLNIPLCWAMAFGHFGFPAMGIDGAAWSTVLSSLFSLILFFFYYLARQNRLAFLVMESFRVDLPVLRRYLRLGLPSGVELFLNVAAFNLFLLMFQSYGVAESAAAAIVFNWDILSFVPMLGLNIGIVSLIGHSVGARSMEKTNEVISAGFVIAIAYSSMLALLFIFFRYPLVDVFAPPQGDFAEIRVLAAFMMIGLCCYTMADAVIQVSGGVLRGAGDTQWVMYSSTALHWIMLVMQYLVIRVWEFGPKASWLVFCAMILAIAIVFLMRLWSGRWRDEEALRAVMAE